MCTQWLVATVLNKQFYILLLGCLFSACTSVSQVDKVVYTTFPRKQSLQASPLPLDTAVFRYPFRVRIAGNRAAVLDLHGPDHFVQVFSYPDFHYVASLGRRGNGPGETLSGDNVRWRDGFLQLLDANKSELTFWQEAAGGDSLVQRDRVKLEEGVLRALDFVQVDDSTFLIPDYSGEARFCWVDRQGRLLGRMGTIPSENEEALTHARPALAQAWRSFVDYNPRNGVLAAVTQLGEVLEVWNLRDYTHVVCLGPMGEPEFRISEGYGIPTGIMGFSDVQVGDSAIYAVFHGHSFRDIAREAQQGKPLPDGGKHLYVFSLMGEPLVDYELDHYIYGISVDEEKGYFVATDVNRDDPIWKYCF